MPTLTYTCQACDRDTRGRLTPGEPVSCMHCGAQQQIDHQAWSDAKADRCPLCGSEELYVRKDFSQRLGVTIIVTGFVAASVCWLLHYSVLTYAILGATALIDAGLYLVTGNALHCYRCHSELRGLQELEGHAPFDLEVYERHRQQAARLKQHEQQQRHEQQA